MFAGFDKVLPPFLGSIAAVSLVFLGQVGAVSAQEGGVRLVTTELRSNDACDTRMVGAEKEEFPVCFVQPIQEWSEVVDLSDAIDLDVKFEFDSDHLTPEAEALLGELAAAMNDADYIDSPFLIEGHTDAVGTDTYNQDLSERRAASVRRFLTSKGVGDVRLQSVGKGESELLDPNNPTGAVNRRVRVVNLSESF